MMNDEFFVDLETLVYELNARELVWPVPAGNWFGLSAMVEFVTQVSEWKLKMIVSSDRKTRKRQAWRRLKRILQMINLKNLRYNSLDPLTNNNQTVQHSLLEKPYTLILSNFYPRDEERNLVTKVNTGRHGYCPWPYHLPLPCCDVFSQLFAWTPNNWA